MQNTQYSSIYKQVSHSFVVCLRQIIRSLFQSEFSTECELVLPLSSIWHLVARLPNSATLPSIFPSITCCKRQFLPKIWPIHLDFLLFIAWRVFFPPWPCVILQFSHHRSNISSLSFSSTFQDSQGTSDQLSEVSNFQHRIQLCSKCSIF